MVLKVQQMIDFKADDFKEKIAQLNTEIENTKEGIVLVTGIGASLVRENCDILKSTKTTKLLPIHNLTYP